MKISEEFCGLATISHGTYMETLPVAGMTVREVRDRLGDRFEIPTQARPYIQARQVAEDTTIHEGQVLGFVRIAGEKGRG